MSGRAAETNSFASFYILTTLDLVPGVMRINGDEAVMLYKYDVAVTPHRSAISNFPAICGKHRRAVRYSNVDAVMRFAFVKVLRDPPRNRPHKSVFGRFNFS